MSKTPLAGLDRLRLPQGLRDLTFCQARVDPDTTGAIAVKTSGEVNPDGTLKTFAIDYWSRMPGGGTAHKMRPVRIECDDLGKLQSVTVRGVEIPPEHEESVDAVFQACAQILDSLKKSELPNAARAFKVNNLAEIIGKNIPVPGQKPEKLFDFGHAVNFNAEYRYGDEKLQLPKDQDLRNALFGNGRNPAMPFNIFDEGAPRVIGSHYAPSRKSYDNCVTVAGQESGSLTIEASILPRDAGEPVYFPELFEVNVNEETPDQLSALALAGKDLTDAAPDAQMRAIGAINVMMEKMKASEAPVPILALAEYNLKDLVTTPANIAARKKSGIPDGLTVRSLTGHGQTSIIGDYGMDLGNCDVISAYGTQAVQDCAYIPQKDGAPNTGAIPDAREAIAASDLVTATHRHLDHIGGFPYFSAQMYGKPTLASPQVHESMRREHSNVHGSNATQMWQKMRPQELTGNGHYTVSKDGGKSGLTVLYGTNLTPHSTYCTPFYYAAFETDKNTGRKIITGIFVNIGDARSEDESEELVRKGKAFFTGGWREELKKAHPDLAKEDMPDRPTYAVWDTTSILHEGLTPRQKEVRANSTILDKWLEGKTKVDAFLASSDILFKIRLQSAARLRRDVTTVGTNMEFGQSLSNKFGHVDPNDPWYAGHQNQIMMDQVYAEEAEREIKKRNERLGEDWFANDWVQICDAFQEYDALSAAKRTTLANELREESPQESGRLIRYLDYLAARKKDEDGAPLETHESLAHKYALLRSTSEENGYTAEQDAHLKLLLCEQLHQKLSDFSNNYYRYLNRAAWVDTYDLDSWQDLGSIVITRNTLTSMHMFADHPEHVDALVTGSQNNDVEAEAQLVKHLENRGLISADPNYRHTARPVENEIVRISTPVIPGNEKRRRQLVQKAVDKGCVVVNAVHDGFEIHNFNLLDEKIRQNILDDLNGAELRERGVSYDTAKLDLGVLSVYNMPAGYRGHGRRKDIEILMGWVNAEMNAAQHCNNPEAAQEVKIIARSLGLGARDMFLNGELVGVNRFDEEKVKSLGQTPVGIILVNEEHPYQRPYRKIRHLEHVVTISPHGAASHLAPLIAGVSDAVELRRELGRIVDPERVDRRAKAGHKTAEKSPAPVDTARPRSARSFFPPPRQGLAPPTPVSTRWRQNKELCTEGPG